MRLVIKGLNYTEVHTQRKGSYLETIRFWKLKRNRKSSECGVWRDGEQIHDFEDLKKGVRVGCKETQP